MTAGLTNAVNLFLMPRIQTPVIKGSWAEVRPANSVEDDTHVDFEISGSGTEYFDLANTFIKAKVRVTTRDGVQRFAKDAEVATINHLLHIMFSEVDVMLNEKNVCSSDYHDVYRAHIGTLLHYVIPL